MLLLTTMPKRPVVSNDLIFSNKVVSCFIRVDNCFLVSSPKGRQVLKLVKLVSQFVMRSSKVKGFWLGREIFFRALFGVFFYRRIITSVWWPHITWPIKNGYAKVIQNIAARSKGNDIPGFFRMNDILGYEVFKIIIMLFIHISFVGMWQVGKKTF